jgi:hypothetical protein
MLLLERRKEGRGQVQKGEEILHSLAMQQQQQQQPTSDPARQARDGVAKKKRKTSPRTPHHIEKKSNGTKYLCCRIILPFLLEKQNLIMTNLTRRRGQGKKLIR